MKPRDFIIWTSQCSIQKQVIGAVLSYM